MAINIFSFNITLEKVFYFLIICLLIWSVGAKYISQHEFIHNKIFQRYNITSEIDINYLTLIGVTYSYDTENKCNDSCKLQHTLNDVIGYNLSLLIYAFVVFTVIKIILNSQFKK